MEKINDAICGMVGKICNRDKPVNLGQVLYINPINIITPSGVTINDLVEFMKTDFRWNECIKSPHDFEKRIPITLYTGPYSNDDYMQKPENIVGFFYKIIDDKLVMYTTYDLWLNNMINKLVEDGVGLCAYPRGMISTIDDEYNTTIHQLVSFDIGIK